MGVGAAGCTRALTRFFSLLQEVRLIRKTHNQFPVQIRCCEHAEPWLDSNLFVTLPSTLHLCAIAEELGQKGIQLEVLDQAIETRSPTGRLLFQRIFPPTLLLDSRVLRDQ